MNLADSWKDYKILDMSGGMKLESWNGIILSRPDPQIIWDEKQTQNYGIKQMLFIIEVKQVVDTGNTKIIFLIDGQLVTKI